MIKIGSPLTAYFLCFCDRFWGHASALLDAHLGTVLFFVRAFEADSFSNKKN